ncbi:MAG: molybdopterin-binding protein [Flavobacteriaceae bacterium]
MNNVKGHIENIEVNGGMSIVSVRAKGNVSMKAIVLENPHTVAYLKKGNAISLLFKETEVVLGRGDMGQISLQNRIMGTIDHIEEGPLLAKVTIATLAGRLVSIISAQASNELGLKEGISVTAMVKLNEVMLQEL